MQLEVELDEGLDDSKPAGSTTDARKPDTFVMPTFDDMAHIRLEQLGRGLEKKTASEVIKAFQNGSRGINHSTWKDEYLESKIQAFRSLDGAIRSGYIEFAQFVNIPGIKNAATTGPGGTDGTFPADNTSSAFTRWLSHQPPKFRKSFKGTKLTENFQQVSTCSKDLRECDTFKLLLKFVQLDKDQSGTLSFLELAEHLAKDQGMKHPAWNKLAVVEAQDFDALHFPKLLTNSILQIAEMQSISRERWTEKKLHWTIASFVRRDHIPIDKVKKEQFTGRLRFFQIADLLPDAPGPGSDFNVAIRGWETKIHVPSVREVAQGAKGITQLSSNDIEAWLKKEVAGKTNMWTLWTEKFPHAKKMADDILRWGEGSIPDLPERPGLVNNYLQASPEGGASSEGDQFTSTAPRMAVFVHLAADPHHDAEIDFEDAYPYLIKEAGKPDG